MMDENVGEVGFLVVLPLVIVSVAALSDYAGEGVGHRGKVAMPCNEYAETLWGENRVQHYLENACLDGGPEWKAKPPRGAMKWPYQIK